MAEKGSFYFKDIRFFPVGRKIRRYGFDGNCGFSCFWSEDQKRGPITASVSGEWHSTLPEESRDYPAVGLIRGETPKLSTTGELNSSGFYQLSFAIRDADHRVRKGLAIVGIPTLGPAFDSKKIITPDDFPFDMSKATISQFHGRLVPDQPFHFMARPEPEALNQISLSGELHFRQSRGFTLASLFGFSKTKTTVQRRQKYP